MEEIELSSYKDLIKVLEMQYSLELKTKTFNFILPENAKLITNIFAGVRSSLVLEKRCSTNELPVHQLEYDVSS